MREISWWWNVSVSWLWFLQSIIISKYSFFEWSDWTVSNVSKKVRITGTFIHCWQEYKLTASLWKTLWPYLLNLNVYVCVCIAKRYTHIPTQPFRFGNSTLCYILKWNESGCPPKDPWKNVHGAFIHNIQNLETTRISMTIKVDE